MQSNTSICIRIIIAVRGCFVLAGLLSTLIFISCVNGMAQSDQVVARGLKTFFEAWLKRELRGDELRKVTDEFIAYFAKKGKDRAGTHEAIKPFLEYAKILREHDGAPMAIRLRHELLEVNYFNPDMQNTTELRLLTEPDPVRVASRTEIVLALMTENDVIALAHLIPFSKSNDEPRSQKFSRQQIDNLAVELDRVYVRTWPNKAGGLTSHLQEAAELWAGIRREWPNLSVEQKGQVRAYAGKGYMAPMTEYLYGKLLDLNQYEASTHFNVDADLFMMGAQVELDSIYFLGRKWW
jgi:hypothetical protein